MLHRLFLILLLVLPTLQVMSSPAWSHGGGLDAYGCHHNRVHGGYHCHRGAFTGAMFDSQAEMLRALEASAPVATELVLKGSFRQVVFMPQDTKAWKLSDHCPISLRVQLG